MASCDCPHEPFYPLSVINFGGLVKSVRRLRSIEKIDSEKKHSILNLKSNEFPPLMIRNIISYIFLKSLENKFLHGHPLLVRASTPLFRVFEFFFFFFAPFVVIQSRRFCHQNLNVLNKYFFSYQYLFRVLSSHGFISKYNEPDVARSLGHWRIPVTRFIRFPTITVFTRPPRRNSPGTHSNSFPAPGFIKRIFPPFLLRLS